MLMFLRSNPIVAGLAALAILAIIFGGIRACQSQVDKQNANLVNQGAQTERSKGNAEAVNQAERAKDAAEHPTVNQLNVVCSKYDRNCPQR